MEGLNFTVKKGSSFTSVGSSYQALEPSLSGPAKVLRFLGRQELDAGFEHRCQHVRPYPALVGGEQEVRGGIFRIWLW